MRLTVGSLFAGIGGFDLGFERAGFEIKWQVEIDPFCRKVLEKHWPGVKRYTDVRMLHAPEPAWVDVIVGGFPCQDLSVSMVGRRRGLSGDRSGLFYQFMRIVDELRPRGVVLENVPGLLSSHGGRDFHAVLAALAERGLRRAYRILDSQYFGVPQRRRRVFVVAGSRGFGERAEQVLFEPESRERDFAAREAARTHLAAGAHYGAGACGVHANQRGELRTSAVAGSLTASRSGKQFEGVLVANTHGAHSLGRGRGSQLEGQGAYVVAPTLQTKAGRLQIEEADSFQVADAGVRRLTPIECERLQGLPDGWTCLCGRGHMGSAFCMCPDTPRYKAIGNAVSVPPAQWIAERIKEAEAVTGDGRMTGGDVQGAGC